MKLKLKPISVTKYVAAGLSALTMCATPLAQGKQAEKVQAARNKMTQKEGISYFLRKTGLNTNKVTVGEYWTMFRSAYPKEFQSYMDKWVNAYHTMPMPQIDATTLKGRDGEQVRLLFSQNGQSFAATFTGDDDAPVKINGVSLTRKEIMDVKNFEGMLKKLASKDASLKKMIDTKPPRRSIDKNVVMTVKEFRKLSARQKAEYFIRLREAAEAAQKVYTTRYGQTAWQELEKKHQWAVQFLLGTPAEAAGSGLAGKPCIVAGWISVYGENGSCGGNTTGARDLERQMSTSRASCSGNSVPCNPMVYGFDSSGGSHCIPRQPRETINNATALCNGKAPIDTPEQKAKIVESYMKKVKGQDIALQLVNGKISEEQYSQVEGFFGDLGAFIAKASEECEKEPLKSIRSGPRGDQTLACDAIKQRAFALDAFRNQPAPPVGGGVDDCAAQMPGSTMMGETCGCPDGTEEGQEGNKPACVPIAGDVLEGKVEKEKKKNNILPILGILAVVGVGIWLFTKDKKKKDPPVVVDPEPPITPAPTPTVSTTPIGPEPNPCLPPKYINGAGACVEDVVLPPDSEGGDKVTPIDDRVGGVR